MRSNVPFARKLNSDTLGVDTEHKLFCCEAFIVNLCVFNGYSNSTPWFVKATQFGLWERHSLCMRKIQAAQYQNLTLVTIGGFKDYLIGHIFSPMKDYEIVALSDTGNRVKTK
jgi:hypothetical protein